MKAAPRSKGDLQSRIFTRTGCFSTIASPTISSQIQSLKISLPTIIHTIELWISWLSTVCLAIFGHKTHDSSPFLGGSVSRVHLFSRYDRQGKQTSLKTWRSSSYSAVFHGSRINKKHLVLLSIICPRLKSSGSSMFTHLCRAPISNIRHRKSSIHDDHKSLLFPLTTSCGRFRLLYPAPLRSYQPTSKYQRLEMPMFPRYGDSFNPIFGVAPISLHICC